MGETVKRAIKDGDLRDLDPERLEELGVDVNECLGIEHYTTLHWACHYGRTEVVEHLFRLGVDVTLTTTHGWTGAHICAIRGCTECLQVLCNEGVDLTATDDRGYTAAHLAAAHGKCSVLQAIINEGVDLSVADRRRWTVVHHAAFHGRLGILQLLSKMVEVDLTKDGNTPTHLAAAEGHLDCLKLLIPHKNTTQTVCCRNNDGATPKDLAVQFHKQDCVDFLSTLDGAAPVQPPGKFLNYESKDYPAHSAAFHGNLHVLSMLIQEGHCGVDDRDPNGATPAHLAAAGGKTDCLQWLVDQGADVSLTNHAHQTPLDLARMSNQVGCIAMLSANEPEDGEPVGTTKASPETIARAGEKVAELERLLGIARSHYRQLGGVSREEVEEVGSEREGDWKQKVDELISQLEFERERRERLEVELDRLRRQLQWSTGQLEHYQALLEAHKTNAGGREGSGLFNQVTRRGERNRRSYPSGGAFVRIDYV